MYPIEIAAKFARCGYHVFPLYRGGNGQKLKPYGWAKNEVIDPDKLDKVIPATLDLDIVSKWGEIVKVKYNSEVIGFGVLGLDCVIIDVDAKDGKPGLDEFKVMLDKFGVVKPKMITVTKSGGLHVYYRRPKALKDSYVKTIAGVSIGQTKFTAIDLRGNGGFVVGPEKLVEDLTDREPGQYVLKGLCPIDELPEFPANVLMGWLRNIPTGDVENLMSSSHASTLDDDHKSQIKRGIIPDFIPKGSRNESFYLLANVLKSRGVPIAIARQMCKLMAERVEEPETLAESVNIEEILTRTYVVKKDNPYDVAVDLINLGLFQLTNFKNKLHYVILEDNPYVTSRVPHDEVSMKTLLAKFQKSVLLDSGKSKIVNPMEVITRIIHDQNRADTLGFKPCLDPVFTMHDDPGAKCFLNTYRPVIIPKKFSGLEDKVWKEFLLLISRIFGPEGSEEYQLGLDFVAWIVQRPHIKPSIAPFIMSYKRGVGKSLFFNVIVQILGVTKDGERQGRLTKLDEISGRFFNPSGCILNLIDEVQFPVHRDTRKESVTFWRHMKNLITAETVSVEIKGGATYQVPNSSALILAGNSGGSFPIEEFDRRLWIVDNNPPFLERGLVDNLFAVVKGQDIGSDDRQNSISTLRYKLAEHKIVLALDSQRAPMTDVKKELFLNSLTDIEEWFMNHFEKPDNLFAATPVISKSALIYVLETSDPTKMSKWMDNIEGVFRDLKRRGYIKPIRAKNNPNLTRQFLCPVIGNDGKLFQSDKKDVLYTTRDHGVYDNLDSKDILYAFIQNSHTIKHFKGLVQKHMSSTLTGEHEKQFEESNLQGDKNKV